MVQSYEPADAVVRHAHQEPHLPQRPGPVQSAPSQPGNGAQELGLIRRSIQSLDVNVIVQAEPGGIDPQRTAEAAPG